MLMRNHAIFSYVGFFGVFIVSLFIFSGSANAATLTVDTSLSTAAVDGDCTIREAILNTNTDANTHADCTGIGAYGSDTINFDIPGVGPHTITPTTPLPIITDDLIIDGITTQEGATCSASILTTPHSIVISIDASGAGVGNGLEISAGTVTVRGLNIYGAVNVGFSGGHGISVVGGSDHLFECNYLGTSVDGESFPATINESAGLIITDSPNNTVVNNLFSGNSAGAGLQLYSFSDLGGFDVRNNIMGLSASQTSNLPNNAGIFIVGDIRDTMIGGTSPEDRNIISGNGGGIGVLRFGDDLPFGISILGNSIFNNTGATITSNLGIDLLVDENADLTADAYVGVNPNDPLDADVDSNALLNYPEITSAEYGNGETQIEFNLDVPAGDYRIEFFANSSPDPTGYGEGQTFIGFVDITHGGVGSESFTAALSSEYADTYISSTTTEATGAGTFGYGSTSEFSQAVLSEEAINGNDNENQEDDELADTGIGIVEQVLFGTSLIALAFISLRLTRKIEN